MSSMYTVSPASLHDLRDHSDSDPHHQHGPITPESHLLSPYSSHAHSNSASPTLNSDTPADTVSSIDYYQPTSEFSEDPFLGTGLVDDFDPFAGDDQDWGQFVAHQVQGNVNLAAYPISPHQTPSISAERTFAPQKQPAFNVQPVTQMPAIPQEDPSADSPGSSQSDAELTPDTNHGSWSSNEAPVEATNTAAMQPQSPQVLVSMWGKEEEAPVPAVESSFAPSNEYSGPMRPAHSVAGDHVYDSIVSISRDGHGGWMPNSETGHRGLAPEQRSAEEVPSLNQDAARRELESRNREVGDWVSRSMGNINAMLQPGTAPNDGDDNIPPGEVEMFTTENRHIPGQTYFQVNGSSGPITDADLDIMRQLPNWGNAPMIHEIRAVQQDEKRYQPETSQAAIDRFYRQMQDNASIISKAATWGTRRRSLPSLADVEGVISGNFLKKLAINTHSRRPSFLSRLPSLSRKPSASGRGKRRGSNTSEVPLEDSGDQLDRQDSKDTLHPPSRTSSWGMAAINKKPPPSLNTALVGIAAGAASIGTQHARSGSISATGIASPKSPFGSLSVPNVAKTLRRPRSKTDLPKPSNAGLSHPNLIGMLKAQGGPPVAQLARSKPMVDQEDDDDEDEDGADEMDLKIEIDRADAIEPNLNGFRAHVLKLNPSLAGADNPRGYLVDRIAHQMVVRYKHLLNAKLKHLSLANQQNCPSGTACLSLGGVVKYLDSRGGDRGVDPLSARGLSSDEDAAPLEGAINTESFPNGIPMPLHATSLPAEFECHICFTSKKFQKPSDWTKHVHEDVQPFTCTWDRCRDPKMFKRKADWVRHENEGHRHLEWWTCDVDECRHQCYRRDNFLQHLVREHKFTEPTPKTKAAIKKAGGGDRTWQKVEQCHVETMRKPNEENCRFCGKTFPTWKKLTVHLAKHMEQICLPVLELVHKKELELDTIISPVQDPPPRHFGIPPIPTPTTPAIKSEPQGVSPHITQTLGHPSPYTPPNHNTLGFSPIHQPQVSMPPQYYGAAQQYHDMSHQSPMMLQPQFSAQPQFQGLPVTTTGYTHPGTSYAMGMQIPETEPFPAFDSLGIQDPSGGIGYQNIGNPALHNVEQYGSNQGSVSPYSHSPHQGHNNGQFYNS
ncbi:hypothetical protein F5Y16DRAFT_321005 [Xylariaceae sp. FL0255]|nr:hypothetical protein F5Y16DRAFT_321005 [Xylariaceae sp. FL0255]